MFEHQIVRKFFLLPNFLSTLEKREYLESYKMVTFGRHPFVRLVSAYKGVIDGNIHDWQKMMNYDKKNPYSVKCLLWQYGLWGFQTGYIKLERFLPKNQHTQRKLMNF